MINANLNFIDQVLRATPHKSNDELIIQRLAVRCFNSGAASLRLARSGYYQPCLAIIRDIIETTMLLQLFAETPAAVGEWSAMTVTEREKKFSPYQVRMKN